MLTDSHVAIKICSWNVAGLRALLRNAPEALEKLVKEHSIDVLCLQETKLQDSHLDDAKLQIRSTVLKPDFDAYYSCSTAKKGYSGTAVFVKRRGMNGKSQATVKDFFASKKKPNPKDSNNDGAGTDDDVVNLVPTGVSYKMSVPDHDQEGRLIKVDFPLFSLINCYIPNSGQKLERLDYRTERWDKDFLKFVQAQPNPTIWLGDLNVAHTNLEVWNDGAKHLATQAGVTQQERDSFQHQLDASGFRDAFRTLHPSAKGCYSYWSQRAGNRAPNKGLRLDYFCCAPYFFDESSNVVARDSYILYDVLGSDHCPVVLELEIKK
jgi:exodeoxyribonuclease-3